MVWEEDELNESPEDGFVPVTFARTRDEAEEIRQILEDHGIEAVLGEEETLAARDDDEETDRDGGFPVLVPELHLDEAEEIIADLEESDEFEIAEDESEEEEDDDLPLGEDDEDGFYQIDEEDLPDDEMPAEEEEEWDEEEEA